MFTIKTNNISKEKRNDVNRWIRGRLEHLFPKKLVDTAILDAMEVECNEPGCAPLEVLIILGFPEFAVDGYKMVPHKWGGKILKPMDDVTETDVINLEIPLRCLNLSLVELDASLDKVLSIAKVEENQRSRDQLIDDFTELLTEKLAVIKTLKQPVTIPSNSILPTVHDAYEVTPVFMASTVNPSIVSGPSTFVQNNLANTGRTTGEISSSSANNTIKTISQSNSIKKASDYIVIKDQAASTKTRHEKGTRPRGCPCCDPDNLDNIIDKMLFMDMPPI